MNELLNSQQDAEVNIGKLAMLLAELQRDIMDIGKHLGAVMQRVQTIDQSVSQKLYQLEQRIATGTSNSVAAASTGMQKQFQVPSAEMLSKLSAASLGAAKQSKSPALKVVTSEETPERA